MTWQVINYLVTKTHSYSSLLYIVFRCYFSSTKQWTYFLNNYIYFLWLWLCLYIPIIFTFYYFNFYYNFYFYFLMPFIYQTSIFIVYFMFIISLISCQWWLLFQWGISNSYNIQRYYSYSYGISFVENIWDWVIVLLLLLASYYSYDYTSLSLSLISSISS